MPAILIENIITKNGEPCLSVKHAVEKFKCPGPCSPDCALYPAVHLSGDTYAHMCHDEIVKKMPRAVLDAMGCSYTIHVSNSPENSDQTRYIAVIKSSAVRDVQFCKNDSLDPLSDDWEDLEDAEIYLGVFYGADALNKAARYASTSPENIRLIPIDTKTVREGDNDA